jgi:hypothetical protein
MKNYTSKSIFVILFSASVLLTISCAKSESTTNRDATAPATTAPTASPAAKATTSSTAAVGVPECDAFLKAYEACVHDKVPAAARPTFETSMANWRKAWHDQAANPQTKAALAGICKTSQDQARTSMKPYGCTF